MCGQIGEEPVKKIRVFIVDDCAVGVDALRGILKPYPDMEVVGEASDGLDAVTAAKALRPDVILMDAQMPGIDGVSICPKSTRPWRRAPTAV